MTAISPEYVEIGDSVIYHTLDDELVLLNMSNQQYYGLDNVGTDMWNSLLENRSVRAAAESMQERYEVDPDTVRGDLQTLVGELVAAGLLKIAAA